jgi:hypothetical protein
MELLKFLSELLLDISTQYVMAYLMLFWLKLQLLWLYVVNIFNIALLISIIFSVALLPFNKRLSLNFHLTMYFYAVLFWFMGWVGLLYLCFAPIYIRRSNKKGRKIFLTTPLINIFQGSGVKWYYINESEK